MASRLKQPISGVWTSAALFVPVALATSTRLGAVDLAYHLRAGAEMLRTRAVMVTDTFTFTAAGLPGLNQQWLSQVAMAATFNLGGWFALVLLRAILVGVSMWFVMASCRARGADARRAAWLTLGSAALALPALGLRPQLFGVACLAATLWLLATRTAHPRRLWFLVSIAACWANLHGTFPLLFVLGGAALLEDATGQRPGWTRLVAVGVTALIATLANPFGAAVWGYVAGIASNPMVVRAVDEWQPPTIASYSGFAFLLSIPVVAWWIVRSRARPAWPQLLALATVLALGLMSTRGTLWWGLLAPVVLASGIQPRETDETPGTTSLANGALAAAFILLAAGTLARWVPFRSAIPVPAHLLAAAPAGVTEALRERLDLGDRVFASQMWASWLEYALPGNPVAVDSRIELFPSAVWDRYAMVASGREGWQRILDEWNVRAVAVSQAQQPALLQRLETDPGWQSVHRDADGAVFTRR